MVDDKNVLKKRRSEFFVYDLLMEINFNNIVEMKKSFAESGGGVSLEEFVRIMKKAIPHKKEREQDIVSRLCELFAEIDIDQDREMTWDEFTSFIIKNGVEPYDPVKTMKKYQEIKPRNEIHFQSLSSLKFFPEIDRLVVCDNNKDKVVKIYKPETYHFQTEYTLVKELGNKHQGAILNAEYIDSKKFLVTSSTDSTLAFWDVDSNYRWRQSYLADFPQLSMVWSEPHSTLFSSDTKGGVHCWSMERPKPSQSFKHAHSDMATSLVLIPNTPLLASGSLDSTILIWDVNTGYKQRELRGHVKGVFSLAYSHEHRFLMSAGSDRDALVWNPMVKSRPIFRLKGHHTSLVGIQIPEGTPQVSPIYLVYIHKHLLLVHCNYT